MKHQHRLLGVPSHPLGTACLAMLIAVLITGTPAIAAPEPGPTPDPAPSADSDAETDEPAFGVGHKTVEVDILGGSGPGSSNGEAKNASTGQSTKNTSPLRTVWDPVDSVGLDECSMDGSMTCRPPEGSCERATGDSAPVMGNGGRLIVPRNLTTGQGDVEGTTIRGTQTNTETDEVTDLGFGCSTPEAPGTPEAAPPVVITVTQSDFARMPVAPLQANAGPADGWLPVNMANVLHADDEVQELDTELLGTPVAIRATPVRFHWDLGDGNTITTTKPGEPYPSEEITATYRGEGWYDVTLTTTFAGQFSVDGGPWQDIDGTIEVASDSVPIFSKSLESRLVNGDVPVDEDEDPWIPERTAETEGPQDPEARHREI